MKSRSFLVVMAVVAAAAFMTGACSRTKTIKTDEGEITLSKEGGVVSIEGEKGKVVASFGEKTELPDNLSKDVPIYKPANVIMSQVMDDGKKVMLGLNTKDGSAKVVEFYKKELAGKGWKIRNTLDMGAMKMLQGVKGTQKINVTINSDGKETNISLAYSGK
jgi:hypothetical protein